MLFLFTLIFPLSAIAGLSIEITKGVDNPTKIAVAPIVFDGDQLSKDISIIIQDDLERSGLFEPIFRENMLSFPSSIKDVYFRD